MESFENVSKMVEHLTTPIHNAAAESIAQVNREGKMKPLTWWNEECEEVETLLKG